MKKENEKSIWDVFVEWAMKQKNIDVYTLNGDDTYILWHEFMTEIHKK